MLTHQKRLYADARMQGKNRTQAAISAGCPAGTARQAGCRYEKDQDVVAYFARHGFDPKSPQEKPVREKKEKAAVVIERVEPEPEPEPVKAEYVGRTGRVYDDPLDFLKDVVNDQMEDPKIRLDAAKSWASYKHAKPGEVGKKEQKLKEAEKTASKFSNVRPIRGA